MIGRARQSGPRGAMLPEPAFEAGRSREVGSRCVVYTGRVPSATRQEFLEATRRGWSVSPDRTLCIPLGVQVLSDQLTPVLAYRRLVEPDERTAPSFLLESVEGGERAGRYSIMGSRPARRVVAQGHEVTLIDERSGQSDLIQSRDPLGLLREVGAGYRLVRAGDPRRLPGCVLGGWFGQLGFDAVRWAEPGRLGFAGAPEDDRGVQDLEFAFYDRVVVFDNASKLATAVRVVMLDPGDDPDIAYQRAMGELAEVLVQIQEGANPQSMGRLDGAVGDGRGELGSNLTRQEHRAMVERAIEYIRAGDVFQVVLGQRFERDSAVDPFDVYRALRAVNPSPYMVYMQTSGCILVASSPEILCRVRREREDDAEGDNRAGSRALVVTSRPLAGTRARGRTEREDQALERELLDDAKERAEHSMLVDLARNDVGRVAVPGTVELVRVMEVERYSHVMHISSTVRGVLRDGLDAFDALRAALPVGTISGAPKVRAIEIIDELEPVRRGPYGGGLGYVSIDGEMDVALALRTMVVPTRAWRDSGGARWTYHVQAAGGIVADSDPDAEYEETVNKSAALGRAIELAERVFGAGS